MSINSKICLTLVACVCVCGTAFAQKTAAKTSSKKGAAAEEEYIEVPEAILRPNITKKQANELIKHYIDVFKDNDMPSNLKQYREKPEKYKKISGTKTKNAIKNLYNFIHKNDSENKGAIDTDLIETTEADPNWFVQLYTIAGKTQNGADAMDQALAVGDPIKYENALRHYQDSVSEIDKFMDKKPTKLDAAKLKNLVEANRERRRKAYIAQYKKLVAEKAAELDRQMKAMDAAAGKNAKNAPKTTTKN